ncbi:large ribosomal subunit protein bL28m [Atheta coriaria]|uniref:large ribosomal subunit protein bL28m n=1 Tax=Dalotia coriaria TaxID=877792 RepID=UPI0031F34492
MASKLLKTLGAYRRHTAFDKGIATRLPEAYRKFYKEWKLDEPAAVHFIPEEGKWKRDEVTNEVYPIQNIPLPLRFPDEYDNQLWGGEAVVQGFQHRSRNSRRVPHFWVPQLHRSVVYSEVLNKHMSVIMTDRALQLINANYGFDHYLLKTPACDLKALLPLKLKRKILQELQNGCPAYNDDKQKQNDVLDRYKQYLSAYTPEEIDWYGYSLRDACTRLQVQLDAENQPVALKQVYRAKLIEELKQAQLSAKDAEVMASETASSNTWMEKMNPFSKKRET